MSQRTSLLVVAAVLCAVPSRGHVSLDQLRREAAGFTAAPPAAAAGRLVEPLLLSYAPRYLKSVKLSLTPAALVALPALLNRPWAHSDSFGGGADRQYLSFGFDRGGEPYMGAMGEGWAHPWFYPIKQGMSGRWQANARIYRVSLDVSIWRSRLNNRIQVLDEGSNTRIYDRTIASLLLRTYAAGETVTVGGRTYKVFHGNALDTSTSPAGIKPNLFDVVFVYDEVSDGDHDYRIYRFRREALVGAAPVPVALYGGQAVGLRVTNDFASLEVYEGL